MLCLHGCLMFIWMVWFELNVRVHGKGQELRSANGGWFEINQSSVICRGEVV